MIDSVEAQKVISQYRNNAIVVPTMTTAYEWPYVSTKPELDMPQGWAMGKASSQALGFAIAQPDKKVMVLDAEGSLLMNLGTLVTIANMAPPNFVQFLFDNSVYRFTGGQPVPNAGKVNFGEMAKAAGFANVYEFYDLESFKNKIETILNQTGPTFVWLKVPPATERPPAPPRKGHTDAIPRFIAAVQSLSE